MWKARARQVVASALVVLALVPVALSGHSHEDASSPAAQDCAACVVTVHSPAAKLLQLPAALPLLQVGVVAPAEQSADADADRSRPSGRAPPLSLLAIDA